MACRGIAVTGEGNNDSDVAISALPASFASRLFGAGPQLALSQAFASQIGVRKSADNCISVSDPGTIVSLGFSKTDGTALPILGGATPGVASGLSAVTGGGDQLLR